MKQTCVWQHPHFNNPSPVTRIVPSLSYSSIQLVARINHRFAQSTFQIPMASSSSPVVQLQPLFSNNNNSRLSSLHASTSDFSLPSSVRKFFYKKKSAATITAMAQPQRSAMQYNQVGDSNLVVSEITFGTVSFFLFHQNFPILFSSSRLYEPNSRSPNCVLSVYLHLTKKFHIWGYKFSAVVLSFLLNFPILCFFSLIIIYHMPSF